MKDVIVESENNISIQALKESLIDIEDKYHFKTLEELQDYCYSFSKNLSNGITESDRIMLLKYDEIRKKNRKVLRGKCKKSNQSSKQVRRSRVSIQLALNFIEPAN